MTTLAIVVDLFGVVCSEVVGFWLPKYFTAAQARELASTLLAAANRGEISQGELFGELARRVDSTAQQVEAEWQSSVRLNQPTLDTLSELDSRIKVGMIVNAPRPFAQSIIDRYSLSSRFDCIVVSSDAGHLKPAPALFAIILQRLDVVAAESIFVDDSPLHVAGASSIGMKGLLFTSALQLRHDLSALGLLEPIATGHDE